MRGHYVRRKAGWDTHGLPVEHEIEKELGILDKSRIEHGSRHRRIHAALPRERLPLRRRLERASPSAWATGSTRRRVLHAQQPVHRNRLVAAQAAVGSRARGSRTTSRCRTIRASARRCPITKSHKATAKSTIRPCSCGSVSRTIRRRRSSRGPRRRGRLPANMALAVHPDVDYAIVARDGERLIVAEPLLAKVFRDEPRRPIARTLRAPSSPACATSRSTTTAASEQDRYYVIPAEFVTTEDGTGVVHIAPAYGPEDLAHRQSARSSYLLQRRLHRPRGAGSDRRRRASSSKTPTSRSSQDLKRAACMFRAETYRHTYPFGWRTGDPLLYIAKTAWFIRTTALQAAAARPTTTRSTGCRRRSSTAASATGSRTTSTGRSRASVSGVRRCRCGPTARSTSASGRSRNCRSCAGRDLSQLDLHRPAIDDDHLHARRPRVQARARSASTRGSTRARCRTRSGTIRSNTETLFEESFPADFICEAVDQTRGWFYSLHAIATMLFDSPAYQKRHLPRPRRRRERREDEQEQGQHPRPVPHLRFGSAPTRCAGISSPAARRARRSGSRSRLVDDGSHAAVPHAVEHREVLHDVRERGQRRRCRRMCRSINAATLDRWAMRPRCNA